MSKRIVIVYWLLLLVPTLVISTIMYHLLRQEQMRIVAMTYATAQERAEIIAETVQLTTSGVKKTITQALLLLPPNNLEQPLLGFKTHTNLVSNVFIWSSEEGLLYPRQDDSTAEAEREFLNRYRTFFSQHFLSQINKAKASGKATLKPYLSENEDFYFSQTKIKRGHTETANGGWIPWFSENRQSVIGWVQQKEDGPIYGVELNLNTLLSWLAGYFSDASQEGMEYAILDSSGEVLYQTGDMGLDSSLKPALSLSLAPHLPKWQIAMYVVGPPSAVQSSKSFVLLASLLLFIFVAAVILGGTILTWHIHRNITHAQQKSSFVSGVSHELKTPLTSIRMFAELLRENRVKDPAKKDHYLQIIVSESQRLTRLVNNVLDFGRLEQGWKRFNFRALELAGYLRKLVETERLRIQEAGMTLDNQIPESGYYVRTDPDVIEQCLLNLVDNAIKYTAEGKVLTVDLDTQDDYLRLRVMDRGPGVPAKHRNRIFEKFHRVDNSLTSPQPGSGLGLSIARTLLREMKGDLLYESREGGGSCFVILFPFRPESKPEEFRKGELAL